MSRIVSIGAWCTLALVLHSSTADAKPAWCGARNEEARKGIRSEVERRLKAQGLTEANLSLVAQLSCDRSEDATLAPVIDAARTRYQTLLGLSAAELGDAMRVRLDPAAFTKQIEDTCATLRPSAEASARDKALLEGKRAALGCQGTVWQADWRRSTADWAYWNDRDIAPASELVSLAVLEQCLDHVYNRDFPDPEQDQVVAGYARCGAEARRLDRARLEAELATMKLSEAARIAALETFARAKLVAGNLETAYQAKAASDPAWKRILFDAPEAGFTAWSEAATKWRPELDLVLAFEAKYDGPSKSAVAGCGPGLRAGWTKYLRAAAPKDAKAAERVANEDPIGYLLASRLLACDHREGRNLAAAYMGTLLTHARRYRGPRRAAAWAAADAISEIRKDREKLPINIALVARGDDPMYGPVANVGNKIGYGENATAEVKAVKKAEGGVIVTFKTVKYKVDITSCTNTNRLRTISRDGTLYWEQNCVSSGSEWRTSTEDPVFIPADLATGVKANQFGTFRPDTQLDPRGDFPTELYTDKTKTKLAVFYGVSLL